MQKNKELTNKSTASNVVKVNCCEKRLCISLQRRNHRDKRRGGSRSLAGNRVARGTGGGGERRLCGWESLNQDEWFSRPGESADSSNPARCEHRQRWNPAAATRRSRLGCWDGTNKKRNILILVWTVQQQAAGFLFPTFLYSFLNYFEITGNSRSNQPPGRKLEVQGGETIRPSQV